MWVHAYDHACRGAFADAEELVRPLCDLGGDVALAALITLGSVLRQTGRHDEAMRVDHVAADRAVRDDHHCDATVSLAADAVGLLDERSCARHLDIAARLAPPDDRRLAIRLGWVRTEYALLRADAREAVAHARRALAEAKTAGWPRHIAKSALFLGAAADAAGAPDADRHLADAISIADAVGAVPIATAACELQGRRRARSFGE